MKHWIKNQARILAALFVTVLFMGPVFADTLSDKSKALNDLNKQIESQEKQLKDISKRKATLQNQIELLDNQINLSQLQLAALNAEIDKTNATMRQINKDLVSAEVEIFNKKQSLQESVRQAYTQQRIGLLEVVIGSANLSDFISQLEYISAIERKITTGISVLQELNASLKDKKGQMEAADKQLKGLQAAEQLQQNSLSSQVEGKKVFLADTKNSEANYQEKLAASIQEQASLQSEIAKLAASAPKNELHPGVLAWPIGSRTVTANFNDPDYYARFHLRHNAIDIATPQGTPIHAPANGYVLKAKDAGMGYSYIMLDHGDGLVTVYGHVSSILVTTGQFIPVGGVIGLSGATPGTPGAGLLTTGPHLHFETWKDGVARNPLAYLVGS